MEDENEEDVIEMEWSEQDTRVQHVFRIMWDDTVNEFVASATHNASPNSATIMWVIDPASARRLQELLAKHL